MDEIVYEELSEEYFAALQQGLARASAFAKVEGALSVAQVQNMYDRIKQAGFAEDPDATIPLGLAFGQLLVDRAGYEWIRVTDEFGGETCVAVPGRRLFCAPISMLQKRMQRDENVDIGELCGDTINRLRELTEGAGDR